MEENVDNKLTELLNAIQSLYADRHFKESTYLLMMRILKCKKKKETPDNNL